MKSILLEDNLHMKLKLHCVNNGITISQFIKEAIEHEFIKVGKQPNGSATAVTNKAKEVTYKVDFELCKHGMRKDLCNRGC